MNPELIRIAHETADQNLLIGFTMIAISGVILVVILILSGLRKIKHN